MKGNPEPKGPLGNGNQDSQGQRHTWRMAISTWAVCFLPGSPGCSSEGRGGWNTQTQAEQTGLNKGSNWEPQQALE